MHAGRTGTAIQLINVYGFDHTAAVTSLSSCRPSNQLLPDQFFPCVVKNDLGMRLRMDFHS